MICCAITMAAATSQQWCNASNMAPPCGPAEPGAVPRTPWPTRVGPRFANFPTESTWKHCPVVRTRGTLRGPCEGPESQHGCSQGRMVSLIILIGVSRFPKTHEMQLSLSQYASLNYWWINPLKSANKLKQQSTCSNLYISTHVNLRKPEVRSLNSCHIAKFRRKGPRIPSSGEGTWGGCRHIYNMYILYIYIYVHNYTPIAYLYMHIVAQLSVELLSTCTMTEQ